MDCYSSTLKETKNERFKVFSDHCMIQSKLELQEQINQKLTVPFTKREDLLMVEGVNPTIEIALNSIGILKYSDFNSFTSKRLSQSLQKWTGISVSAKTIENQKWFEQANKLDNENKALSQFGGKTEFTEENSMNNKKLQKEDSGTKESEEAVNQFHQETEGESTEEKAEELLSINKGKQSSVTAGKEENEKMVDPHSPVHERPIQLKRNIKNNKISSEKNIPEKKNIKSVNSSEMTKQFIANRSTIQKSKKQTDFDNEFRLKITSANFNQIAQPGILNWNGKKKIRGEIICNITDNEMKSKIRDDVVLFVQIFATDMHIKENILMISKSFDLKYEQTIYKIYLEFDVPQIGYYRLNTVVFLLVPEPKIDFKEGPFLRVVLE